MPESTAAVRTAFREAKDLVGDCIAAAKNAFEDEQPEVLEAFLAGPKIGQSLAKLNAKIGLLIPLSATHAEALSTWGEPEISSRLAAAQEAVRAEDAAQEKAFTELPRKTAELYEAKGQLFALIKKLNRAARRTFKGEEEKARRYNLDIVYRRSSSKPAGPAGGGGGTGPTT